MEALFVAVSSSVSAGIEITPQYSNDLQTWYPDANKISTGTNAPPYLKTEAFSGPTNRPLNAFRYVRLKVENLDTTRILVSANASFYSVDT